MTTAEQGSDDKTESASLHVRFTELYSLVNEKKLV